MGIRYFQMGKRWKGETAKLTSPLSIISISSARDCAISKIREAAVGVASEVLHGSCCFRRVIKAMVMTIPDVRWPVNRIRIMIAISVSLETLSRAICGSVLEMKPETPSRFSLGLSV